MLLPSISNFEILRREVSSNAGGEERVNTMARTNKKERRIMTMEERRGILLMNEKELYAIREGTQLMALEACFMMVMLVWIGFVIAAMSTRRKHTTITLVHAITFQVVVDHWRRDRRLGSFWRMVVFSEIASPKRKGNERNPAWWRKSTVRNPHMSQLTTMTPQTVVAAVTRMSH